MKERRKEGRKEGMEEGRNKQEHNKDCENRKSLRASGIAFGKTSSRRKSSANGLLGVNIRGLSRSFICTFFLMKISPPGFHCFSVFEYSSFSFLMSRKMQNPMDRMTFFVLSLFFCSYFVFSFEGSSHKFIHLSDGWSGPNYRVEIKRSADQSLRDKLKRSSDQSRGLKPPDRIHEGSFAFGGRGYGGCKKCTRRKKSRHISFDSTLGKSLFLLLSITTYSFIHLYTGYPGEGPINIFTESTKENWTYNVDNGVF